MIPKKIILLLFLSIIVFNSSNIYAQTFNEIRAKYENLGENDNNALPFIKNYILKAKKENDLSCLVRGYLDGSFYNSIPSIKIKYADSAIVSAKLSRDNQLIGEAYATKGSLYYFYYKKYKFALNEYVNSFDYTKKTNDLFLNNMVMYHMGVVKSYLGYYPEALENFTNCIAYFEPLSNNKNLHPNLIFNNKKGYYNSLHQAIVSYRNLGKFKTADSLINVGLSKTAYLKEFPLEYAYFLKCKGIVNYHNRSYKESVKLLKKALPEIKKNKDFAWESVSYFYLGKSYLALNENKEATNYFNKVDSIFKKNNFILPELRENYEILINESKNKNDTKKELYYTKQLLKADSIISKDFNYLSSKIHKEYDTQQLLDAKDSLESKSDWWISITSILIFSLLIILFYQYRKEKNIQKKFFDLEQKIKQNTSIVPVQNMEIVHLSKSNLNENTINDILKKLEKFESKLEFTEKGLTLNKLAKKFDTNSNYLSQVISEKRSLNFNKYLSELRINYITKKMYEDKDFLKYTIESLAEKCGIASRQNFSDLFYEINGIRPTDFIKQRKKELEGQGGF